jgi:hypothetical protein
MPRWYASQFRAMVIEQVRNGRRVADVAASVEVPEVMVFRWVRQDRIERIAAMCITDIPFCASTSG